jgi:hypothetical protein
MDDKIDTSRKQIPLRKLKINPTAKIPRFRCKRALREMANQGRTLPDGLSS